MTARRLDRNVDSKCSCASDSDDIAIDSGLRRQKFKRRILGGPPLLYLSVSAQINCKRIDSNGGQLLSYIVPRFACAVALMKQQYAGSWLCRCEVRSFQDRAVLGFDIDSAAALGRLGRQLCSGKYCDCE
jgi:hypothetical protein